MAQKVALVTGGNRGIGFEVCSQLAQRGFTVMLGSRNLEKGQQAAAQLSRENLQVEAVQLDVSSQENVEQAAQTIEQRYQRPDVLVNNAAILYDTWQRAANADLQVVHEALETNLCGAWRMCQAFLPLMRRNHYGRIVNVSSEAGSLAGMGSGEPAYRVSKVGLNALTRMLADEVRGSGILVNAICPGWVATEMGGAGGRPVREGAAGIVWAATLPDNGPNGGFFRDEKPLPW
ncbi:MAG TPA: SDR family oxidoreductase [Chloroflexia bacterium]|nr:SDR family oxidoreductase [Chloroflexia bacterium]